MSSTEFGIPFIAADQMREVDRAMIEDHGIVLMQMMENAGRHLAALARSRFLAGDPRGRGVVILVGKGGNGGGGLVCGRRLHNWGANVRVCLAAPGEELGEVPRHQLAALEGMGVGVAEAGELADLPAADIVVDALIGYSLRGDPQGPAAALIRAANGHRAPVLALDVPSGVDSTTGAAHEPAVQATATLTLALPKTGLRDARRLVGELYLADIGVPPQLYKGLGLDVGPIFAMDEIIRVW